MLMRKRNVGKAAAIRVPVSNASTVRRVEIANQSDESALSRDSRVGDAVQPTEMGEEFLDLVIIELFNVDSELEHLRIGAIAMGEHVGCLDLSLISDYGVLDSLCVDLERMRMLWEVDEAKPSSDSCTEALSEWII
jgi:hypothetical protein